MARKKRTDNRGRGLRTGESQNKDGRYCFKWMDGTGKRNTTYSVNLVELREKEKQIQRDMEDGINANSANMTLNQLFAIYMESKSNIRESTRIDGLVKAYNRKEVINAESEHRDPILLPHISPHMLRHTFCTRCAEAGLDIKVLQMIMGHSDISITMNIYNHVDAARVQNEMKKLENVM